MAETTKIVGYFNGHKFPIHLSISALNLTLRLEPGEYIVDRQQRKINDPFLEAYAGKTQLSREVSKTPVPVLTIPRFGATRPPTGESSVREVTEFTEDKGRVRRPMLPAPRTEQPPEENVSSFKAMSMDEARRMGFVHKTREVPEDFGVTETQNGVPAGRIPEIKYATDLGPGGNKTALPKTVVQPKLKATVPVKTPRKALAESTTPPVPAAPAPVAAKPAKSTAAKPPVQPPSRRASAVTPAPEASSLFGNKVVSDLPPPVLEDEPSDEESAADAQDAEEAIAQTGDDQPEEQPEEQSEQNGEPGDEPAEGTALPASFVCLKDGKVFGTRQELVGHIQANYPRQMKALMSAYPE